MARVIDDELRQMLKEEADELKQESNHPTTLLGRFFQEAKLTTTKRGKLKDSEFGIPEKRTFPLNDKNHVEAAVKMFPHADSSDRKTLAKRILSKAKEFNMDTSGWDTINKYGIDKQTISN